VAVTDDDGKPTGRDKVVVTYTERKEDSWETLELTPVEVFQKMVKDTDTYGNLFDTKARGGLGADNGDAGKKTGYRPGMSMADFVKIRKENPNAIYGS
jgi:hypothetical protein